MTDVFDGLDDIGWADMSHAYGPAVEVPGWVRGLVDDDPAVREECLDAMYGAVNHQGDVYDSTVAALPYLLGIVASDLPGRSDVLRLIASIGAADHEEPVEDFSETIDGVTYTLLLGTGRRLVAEARSLFLGLLDDPDPALRSAAAEALAAGRDDVSEIVSALRDRMGSETDREVRSTLIATVAAFGRMAAAGDATGIDPREVTAWLAARAEPPAEDPAGPSISEPADAATLRAALSAAMDRLEATVALLRAEAALDGISPEGADDDRAEASGPDVVDRALADLSTIYDYSDAAVEAAGFHTDTLIGALREDRESSLGGRVAPEAAEMVRSLADALDVRVEARTKFLLSLLRTTTVEPRLDAVGPASVVVQGLRGEHRSLVEAMAEGLDYGHDGLLLATVSSLRHLDRLATPAADGLAAIVERGDADTDHPLGWFRVWAGDGRVTVAEALDTLASAGDPRAVEPLRALLGRDVVPGDLGHVIARMGRAGLVLLPEVVARLGSSEPSSSGTKRGLWSRVKPGTEATSSAGPRAADLGGATDPLLRAVASLGRLAPGQAVADGALEMLVAHLPSELAVSALGSLGRLAQSAVDQLTPLLDPEASPFALGRVATALGLIGGDPDVIIAALRPRLSGSVAHQAVAALQPLGPDAEPVLDLLMLLVASDDEADPHGWVRVEAGSAVWAITGYAELALPALSGAWRANVHTRYKVAGVWGEMGAAATAARPLVEAEMADPRRLGARSSGWGSGQVRDDLALLDALSSIAC